MTQSKTEVVGAAPKSAFSAALKKQLPRVVTASIAFLAVAVIAFFNVSRNTTVASFALDEYEIGQVADRTIVADRALPSTMEYPTVVQKGEKVIRKGFVISEEAYRKLEKMANVREYIDYRAFADALIYFAVLIVLWFFLFSKTLVGHTPLLKESVVQVLFFLANYAAAVFVQKLPFAASSPYKLCIFLPNLLFIFLIVILFGEKQAVFFALISALGLFNASNFSLIVFFYTLSTGFVCCRIIRKLENRIQMVFAALITAMLNVLTAFLLKVIFDDNFDSAGIIAFGLAINGFLSGILVLGLVTPLEQILNTASVFRLIDLSDLNNPMMRKMLLTASGTYNHSLMVAQLAENACKAIGANSLMARVGAYYHDVGKIDQSEYFVENQSGQNKHDEINPNLSVSIIRSHVKKGVEIANSLRLPRQVIDIISEHHGNGVMQYFYQEALKANPDTKPEDYSYFGNPPTSRESGVVMLADTVEAACRTLDKPTVPRLEKFIHTLIEAKMQAGQLKNCALTFGELTKIQDTFVSILAGYYHSRIEYPDQKDPDAGSKEKEKEGKSAKKGKGEGKSDGK
ncbi:MAG: HDIG domain-containing protein [Treponema sp.]|nr:HDIG domain-containing protein [Treponema sp.]